MRRGRRQFLYGGQPGLDGLTDAVDGNRELARSVEMSQGINHGQSKYSGRHIFNLTNATTFL
jgi:hypothetical protein